MVTADAGSAQNLAALPCPANPLTQALSSAFATRRLAAAWLWENIRISEPTFAVLIFGGSTIQQGLLVTSTLGNSASRCARFYFSLQELLVFKTGCNLVLDEKTRNFPNSFEFPTAGYSRLVRLAPFS